MTALTTALWFLLVYRAATGMVVIPEPFASQEQCDMAADQLVNEINSMGVVCVQVPVEAPMEATEQ